MNAERPQTKVYRAVPVPRSDVALGGVFRVLETQGLVIDQVILSPVEGRTCVGVAVTIPDDKQRPIEYGMYLYESDLKFIGSKLRGVKVEDPNSPMARVIDIWTKASQALKEAKERQT